MSHQELKRGYVEGYEGKIKTRGTSQERQDVPVSARYPGFQFWDTTLDKPCWWDGTEWKTVVLADAD